MNVEPERLELTIDYNSLEAYRQLFESNGTMRLNGKDWIVEQWHAVNTLGQIRCSVCLLEVKKIQFTPEQYAEYCDNQITACGTAGTLAEIAATLKREMDYLDKGRKSSRLNQAYRLLKEEIACYAGIDDDTA